MDYETASDFEINKAVAEALGSYGICDRRGDVLVRNKPFDPCNSWADAGPIIVENKGCISYAGLLGWYAANNPDGDNLIQFWDKNPLRAAMIVFLKMQEQR